MVRPEPDGPTTTKPAQISTMDVWDLHARPDQLDSGATQWRAVTTAVKTAADDVDRAAKALVNGVWEGPAADSFDNHRKKLIADLDAAEEASTAAAAALDKAAGALRSSQSHLTEEWGKVVSVQFTYDGTYHLTFSPEDDAEAKVVHDSMTRCAQIRGDLDDVLQDCVSDFSKARAKFKQVAATWLNVADGSTDPFTMPPEVNETGVIYDGNKVIVNTGTGDDDVQISVDPKTGQQIVTINGQKYYFPAGADIVVRGGDGNDTISVAKGTNVHVTLLGGEGDDIISGGDGDETILGLDGRDRITAGAGNDRVSAGADRDYVDGGYGDNILSGGLGDDTVYGLDGRDQISGGEGQDYLEGGKGDDSIYGGAGNDIISGGRGNDTLRAGGGDDVVYAGRDNDTTYGGTGQDKVFGEKNDTSVGAEQNVTVEIKDFQTFINVEGSPEFKARIEADLDMLASSPRGQQMLTELQAGHDKTEGGWWLWHHDGDSLTIKEYNNPADPNNSTASHSGGDNTINLNVHLDELTMGNGQTVQGPPVAVLYHEMAHVYDYMNDSLAPGDYSGPDNPGVPNREREAAGLPIDEDGDPNTPTNIYSKHRFELTENGLREEMGAPHRDAY
ncbi:MAG: calcium-binding protein [Hamadaea sp.]|uniref:M91 family zinc metallopeptidase n=1 Tax=Hamadaea sp. NPDC050747 TaxID=3155789 RepID=UPI0017C2B371|nr:calcium-binding protein [Hamadaea sp.]NUR52112.1 calcium-binding protein [Hamadaea sp.]NUT03047.1 calcium-binding protein [Hamadaea sp.]